MAWILFIFLSALPPTLAPSQESAPGWVIDLGFRVEVERWVAATVYRPAPPAVRLLGAARYGDREAAHRAIQDRGEAALRDVARAMTDRDPEIAHRGRLLYESLFLCRDCRGAGIFYRPPRDCVACRGTRTPPWIVCRICEGTGLKWADIACSACRGSGSWLFGAALTRPGYVGPLGLVDVKRRHWFAQRLWRRDK